MYFFFKGAGPRPNGWERSSRSHPKGVDQPLSLFSGRFGEAGLW